jgi:hypothetical protein
MNCQLLSRGIERRRLRKDEDKTPGRHGTEVRVICRMFWRRKENVMAVCLEVVSLNVRIIT